jgi:hypothetical protein
VTERNHWLPPLVLLEDYEGEWNRYVEKVYEYFKQDFVDHKPIFRGRRLNLKRHPVSHGKEATFWHLTSEGKDEANRTPDLRRCERIRWPRPIIELADAKGVKVWASIRNNERRIHLWLESEDYLVVLADRGDYLLPWTAFLITRDHTRRKLQKDYEACRNAGGLKS